MNLRTQKSFYNKLLQLLHSCDTLGIELDAEWVKDGVFDKMSLILSGISATLPLVLKELEMEISITAEGERMQRELGQIIDDEQSRFKRLPQEHPDRDDEEDEGEFENGL